MKDTLRAGWRFVIRWQEQTMLLPLLLLIGLLAWLILAALDRTAGADVLNEWVRLPIACAYAIAAGFATHHARRRWRKRLTDEDQAKWWAGVQKGERGPLIVYLTDAGVTVLCLVSFLLFFSYF